jgi:hypothetical protein
MTTLSFLIRGYFRSMRIRVPETKPLSACTWPLRHKEEWRYRSIVLDLRTHKGEW